MRRDTVSHLVSFVVVAQKRSFTRAATKQAKPGVSQSSLSHSLRGLEERLGLPLLMRMLCRHGARQKVS